MKPDISIIMPIFNGERWLNDSIGSIYKTILKTSWELLLCDDGSTDHTRAAIKNKYLHDKRVNLVFEDEINRGAAIARNIMINQAQADTIMILDCDNILCDGVVDQMYQSINTETSVVSPEKIQYFTDPKNIDPTDCWDFAYLNGKCDKQDMVRSFNVPPCSGNYMYRKEVWEKVDGYHKKDIQETWGFGFRHIFAGYPIKILPGTQYLHRFLRDGYYMRLPKCEMDLACWQLLRDHDRWFDDDSEKHLLDIKPRGKDAILSGKIKLK